MANSNYRAFRDVRAKTNQVVQYHRDEALPGKPLHWLIPGGLIALASLALIVYILYRALLDESLDPSLAWPLVLLLAPVYIGGVFVFSYGYELYDLKKALRLTAIVVLLTLAAVVIVAVLLVLLGDSKSSSSSSSSSSHDSGHSSSSKGVSHSTPSSGSGSSSSSSGGGGDWDFFPSINIHTGTVAASAAQTSAAAIPPAPPAPQPIQCPFCGRSYVPSETKFACPACGAATPADLLSDDSSPGAS